jgi:hypothetical protein
MINTSSDSKTPAEAQPGAGSEGILGNERSASPSPREPSKTQKVLSLLKRPGGATLDELVETTGWRPHSSRAALTGLKKKGHEIQRTKVDGVSRYAVMETPSR